MASISSVNAYFTDLINQLMAIERQPIDTLRLQKTDLNVKSGVFSDLGTKLGALQTAVDSFKSAAATSVFDQRAAIISGVATGNTVVTASASSSAAEGAYALAVTTLAREHRLRSDQQTYSDQALNLTGTFVVGGAAARSQTTTATIADTVTAFGIAAPASGQKEIGSGTYYVETRNDSTSGWQFRLVDADGKAVSIKQGTSTTYTSGWQSIPTGGGAYDTGRSLTITFGATSGLYQAASKGAGAAQLAYTAQGASLTVAATNSLDAIASAINNATYADGNAVTASVVDRQLVLAAKDTGAAHTIAAADTNGAVLQSLGVLTGAGAFKNEMQTALNAAFTVNTLSVTRSKNTGLDDVISGVTLNLAADAAGKTATLSVSRDNAAVRTKVENLLTQINGATGYLQLKTAVTGKGSDRAAAAYTRGALADDFAYSALRNDLINDAMGRVAGLPAGSPGSLTEIGVSLNDTLEVGITDSAKFEAALANNASGVKALLAAVADKVNTRLDRFTNSTSGTLVLSQKSVAEEMSSIDERITQMNEVLAQRRTALTGEYAALQAQVLNNMYTQQTLSSFSAGGFSYFA